MAQRTEALTAKSQQPEFDPGTHWKKKKEFVSFFSDFIPGPVMYAPK